MTSKTSSDRISSWLLGFLAFVPILGGIVGFFLLLIGLTRKRRSYIILGIIGVTLTSAMVLYLNYYSKHRGVFDEARIYDSKRRMKEIVKYLEFFRINTGNYPDSLQELTLPPTISPIDPIQQVQPDGANKGFYYKRIGNRYFFFSKGFDGKEFTIDDLYPPLEDVQINKIGIILEDSADFNLGKEDP